MPLVMAIRVGDDEKAISGFRKPRRSAVRRPTHSRLQRVGTNLPLVEAAVGNHEDADSGRSVLRLTVQAAEPKAMAAIQVPRVVKARFANELLILAILCRVIPREA